MPEACANPDVTPLSAASSSRLLIEDLDISSTRAAGSPPEKLRGTFEPMRKPTEDLRIGFNRYKDHSGGDAATEVPIEQNNDTNMKRYLTIALKISGLALFGLLASSCDNSSTGSGTHQMGPPGKGNPVSDDAHPSMAH